MKLRARAAPDKILRTDAILEAGREIWSRNPFEFSMTDVAERAGVAKGTLYLYFQTKTDLLGAIAERCVSAMGGDAARRHSFAATRDETRMLLDEAREAHRLLSAETQLSGCLLLQGGRDEGRDRVAALLAHRDGADRIRRAIQIGDNLVRCLFIPDLRGFVRPLV